MGIMNEVKQGENLVHPKPSIAWVVSAVVAMAVLGIAYWIYQKAKAKTSGITGSVSKVTSGLEAQASQQLDGFL